MDLLQLELTYLVASDDFIAGEPNLYYFLLLINLQGRILLPFPFVGV